MATIPRLSEFLRAVFAFLTGVLAFTALVLAFSKIAGIETPPGQEGEKPAEVIVCLAAAMALAGYWTARISGRWEVLLSAGLGLLLSLGAGPAHMDWQGIKPPLSQALSLLLLPACAAWGGWAAHHVARSQERKRAEAPLQLPLAIRQWRALVWLGFFLSLGMTATAVWILRTGHEPGLGWSAAALFGAGTLLLGWQGIRNKPQAVLREEGIEITAFRTVIPWSEVEDAVASTSHPIEYVRFHIRHPERYMGRLTPLQQFLLRFTQQGESEPNIGVVLMGTPYTAEEICELVRARAAVGSWRRL